MKKNKEIQLTVNIGAADLERKAKQAAKFREKGHGVHAKLKLRRGREEARTDDAMQVMEKFLIIAEIPLVKANPPSWSNSVLITYISP